MFSSAAYFFNAFSLRSSLNVRDQVLHPNKTTGKITVLYILVFIFSYGKMEDKTFCAEQQRASLTSKKKSLPMKYENS
jgi:hypothetical protein